jgi:hypothetical protein
LTWVNEERACKCLYGTALRVSASRVSCPRFPEEISMLDLIMVALGVGFFVLALGYCVACDRM